MLEPKAVRLHKAHRAAITERPKYAGMTPEATEAGLVAWEARADAEGRPRGDAAYWDGAED